eukprot:450879-Pelagomonas_calceolata.AAC.5
MGPGQPPDILTKTFGESLDFEVSITGVCYNRVLKSHTCGWLLGYPARGAPGTAQELLPGAQEMHPPDCHIPTQL